MTKFKYRNKQQGAALAETVIILPVFLILALGTVQWMMIYQARSTVNYAALMAARAGATSGLEQEKMMRGFGKGLAPLFSLSPLASNPTQFFADLDQIILTDVEPNTKIRILNPTVEAFNDHGRINFQGTRQIANDRLHLRPDRLGGTSNVNIQDANILKIKAIYCHRMIVPFANSVIATVSSWFTQDQDSLDCLANNRIPILATSVVRMQSPARQNDWVMEIKDINQRLSEAITPLPGTPSEPGHRPWKSGPTGQN